MPRSTSVWPTIAVAVGFVSCLGPAAAQEHDVPQVQQYLTSGRLAEGERVLSAQLEQQPQDDQARYGLGVIRFVQAIERVAQSLHRYGVHSSAGRDIPILRIPVPENADPQPFRYEDGQRMLQTWINNLQKTEETLADIRDQNVKLPLHIGRIRLDMNSDGQASDAETLWQIYRHFNRRANDSNVLVALDYGDVHWLRGYCHLLMAMAEVALAYDGQELFQRTAHLLFPRAESPYPFLREGKSVFEFGGQDLADVIALIHLLNFPLADGQRLKTALDHLLAMINHSRASWKAIQSETDNDHEWIPNAKQTSAVANVRVTQPMINGWFEFLDEAEALLTGKKLAPFWRSDAVGVNINRVFTEPRRFDLILWIQGTAATPYLEQGPMTKRETWQRFNRIFHGEFIGFAIWFN